MLGFLNEKMLSFQSRQTINLKTKRGCLQILFSGLEQFRSRIFHYAKVPINSINFLFICFIIRNSDVQSLSKIHSLSPITNMYGFESLNL